MLVGFIVVSIFVMIFAVVVGGIFHDDFFAWWYSRIVEVESEDERKHGGPSVLHCKLHYPWGKKVQRVFVVTRASDSRFCFSGYWADTGKQDEYMWRACHEWSNVAQARKLLAQRVETVTKAKTA